MENRVKEQFQLFSDCTSTHWLWSNQLRLYFSAFAYVLVDSLRRLALPRTTLAQAEVNTIRLRLLKIGARERAANLCVAGQCASGHSCVRPGLASTALLTGQPVAQEGGGPFIDNQSEATEHEQKERCL